MTTLAPLLFRIPPRESRLELAIGSGGAYARDVTLILHSPDAVAGFGNCVEMQIWGDLDPYYRRGEFAQAALDPARWVPYQPSLSAVLAAGDGTKTLGVRYRNASGYVTEDIETEFEMRTLGPHVSILWDDGLRLLHSDGVKRFGWSASHDFDSWQIMLAPSAVAEYPDCVVLQEGAAGAAGEHHWAAIDVDDIETADLNPTQPGAKFLRVVIEVGGMYYGAFAETTLVLPTLVWDAGNWDEGSWL